MPVSETSDALPIVYREPVGPVLGIAPWNASSVLGLRSFGTPIAAGCTAVFKVIYSSVFFFFFWQTSFLI